jgi:hypothetical protein
MSNFNHFMPKPYLEAECLDMSNHIWVPTAQTKRFGKDVAVQVYCKNCKAREWSVLAETDFRLAQRQWEVLQ